MLKRNLQIFILLFFLGNGVFAQQWGGSTTENGVIARAGNVGLGTGNPRGKLDIWGGTLHVTGSDQNGTLIAGAMGGNAYLGSDALTNAISITPTGWVGIGTVSTGYTLDVNGNTRTKLIDINNGSSDGGRLVWRGGLNGTQEYRARIAPEGFLAFFPGEGAPTTLTLTANGNVGIGTSYPGAYKLAVEGKIAARGVKVTNTAFADYVFEPNYRLRPLSSVENYITENKHLPGMPSAKEVEKDGGFELSTMNVKLLEKIEELTLYVIEQNKQIQALKKQVETLEKK
jgi:hypothetical protein